jgi:hypothetical protein
MHFDPTRLLTPLALDVDGVFTDCATVEEFKTFLVSSNSAHRSNVPAR